MCSWTPCSLLYCLLRPDLVTFLACFGLLCTNSSKFAERTDCHDSQFSTYWLEMTCQLFGYGDCFFFLVCRGPHFVFLLQHKPILKVKACREKSQEEHTWLFLDHLGLHAKFDRKNSKKHFFFVAKWSLLYCAVAQVEFTTSVTMKKAKSLQGVACRIPFFDDWSFQSQAFSLLPFQGALAQASSK